MKRLNQMLELLRPSPRAHKYNMRGAYEAAAILQGWTKRTGDTSHSEWYKRDRANTVKRLVIETGDRIRFSLDGVTWKDFGQTARKRFLLGGQREI